MENKTMAFLLVFSISFAIGMYYAANLIIYGVNEETAFKKCNDGWRIALENYTCLPTNSSMCNIGGVLKECPNFDRLNLSMDRVGK